MTIRNKLMLLISILLSVTVLIAGTISYFQTTDLVSKRLYNNELPATVLSIRNNIEKKLNVYLTTSFAVADNTFVLDWFAQGEPVEGLEAWQKYASKIQQRTKAFNVSLVSNVSRKYYDQNGYNESASGAIKFWFDAFIDSNQPYEMVLDKNETTGNEWKMFTNVRVDVNGKLASVGLGVGAEELAKDIANIKVGKSGFVYLTTADGTIKLHRNAELIGNENITKSVGISNVADTLLNVSSDVDENAVNFASYTGSNGDMIVGASWIPSIQSFVIVKVPAVEVFGDITQSMKEIGLIVLVILAGAMFVVFLIARQISSPINKITDVVGQLTQGNTDVEVPAQEGRDEIGAIARAVEVFRLGIIQNTKLENEQKGAAQRNEEEKRKLMSKMAEDFENSVGSVVDFVSNAAADLKHTAQSMSAISEQTRAQASTVAKASSEASSNVQTVAAATEELTSSSNEISQQVSQSATVAREAVDQATHSKNNISELIDAAEKIGAVISLITDIAEQTNLLALNATIEAARAGDAGKGFVVVASEVKNLANQTGKATEEIRGQVEGIQSSTRLAADSIDNISETIQQIDQIAASVAAAVEEQTAATQEIARNVDQAAAGTQEVSANIGGVTEASGEVGKVSNQVLSAADELGSNSDRLKQEVENFLVQIRTAS
ncbi:methyl-accepting chemotaxis protein [Kiloniella litopenaei]|uniref:methyl-accepting chemotaxis protein n=1 Tax=Kiloniella litopenaei TaxID=1549748 RepID=UPI003BABA90D